MGAREARRLIERARRQGLQVPPDGAGLPAERPHGLADLRGDRRAQAAGDLPQRPFGHRLRACAAAAACGCRTATRCCSRTWRSTSPTCRSSSRTRSWPWQDEALSLALHKPNVWIDLSGWSPKYFPPQLVQYANTLLKDRMLFGSDFPLITPERWMKRLRRGRLQGQGQAADPEGQRDAAAGAGAGGGGVMPASLQACRFEPRPAAVFQGAKTGAIAAPTSLGARHWHMRWSPSLRPGLVGSSAFRTETSSAAPES